MNNFNKAGTFALLTTISLLQGCAGGGGYPTGNIAAAPAFGAAVDPMAAVEGAVINSLAQNMAGSVMNGQIGSQIAPVDQNFRLQQLGNLVQSGAVNQAQQWVNPQTGSTIALNPVGQALLHPQSQQPCQNLQEVVTLQNGQSITENRQACLDSQSGKWVLVQ